MKKLLLIDAHAIIHRAYHALPPLTAPGGEPANAVYGFTTILLRMLRELKPDYIAAAFDLPGPTFRHIAYERYKTQRPETPSDLAGQFRKAEEIAEALGIIVLKKEAFEADDIIGTIAQKLVKRKDIEVIVVTGDLDLLQLVRKGLKVHAMKKGISEIAVYDRAAVKERYGLAPSQLVDFKGLKGDPSDNIKGVSGVGEKTALQLLQTFGSIEKLYRALKKKKDAAKLSAGLVKKLIEGEEDARLSRELAAIRVNVPIRFSLEQARCKGLKDHSRIEPLFQGLGFFSLLKRLREEGERFSGKSDKKQEYPEDRALAAPVQTSFFTDGEDTSLQRRMLREPSEWEEYLAEEGKGRRAILLVGQELFFVDEKGGVAGVSKKLFSERGVREYFVQLHDAIVHDGKSIIHFLRSHGMGLGGVGYDLMLASYVAGFAGRDFSYPAIVSRELGRLVAADAREELGHFFEVKKRLDAKIAAGHLEKVFYEIEAPLVKILADMEERGVLLDADILKNLSREVEMKLETLTKRIHKDAGSPFNINSSQQLSRVLFDTLKIKTHGLRKTEKGGVISTRESELGKLKGAHPIVEKILEYRELAKLKSTYIDALPALVNPATGRLHTTFHQAGTATGRLSSSNPNLQNIPALSEYGRRIRNAFVAGPGFAFVSFDYSQIELRLAAHIAGDKKMIEAFQHGLDIHKMTAAEIYNVPLENVTPELRRAAKTLNFGVLYGMGPMALAESTGMSREEAARFIEEYFKDFSGIRDYIARTKEFAREHGYVETIFGRRRYIPEILSPNWQIKREAERMAVNHPIQGSSTGDIIKLAMIKAEEWIGKEGLGEKVRMLLQVHDELVFEIAAPGLQKYASQIRKIMECAVELKVPLLVDVKAGQNWGEQAGV